MRIVTQLFSLGLLSYSLSFAAWGQAPSPTDAQIKKIAEDTAAATVAELNQQKFAGLDFGVGLSLTIDTGSHDRVKNAEIIDGVVRVTKENNATARIMLESHYFFTPDTFFGKPLRQKLSTNPKTFGVGPFIALQPGTDEIIEAIGAGVMIGFKRPEPSKGSWNLGVGYVVDPNVQILGDGFTENQPPPGAETQIRYKETNQQGVMVLASFTF